MYQDEEPGSSIDSQGNRNRKLVVVDANVKVTAYRVE